MQGAGFRVPHFVSARYGSGRRLLPVDPFHGVFQAMISDIIKYPMHVGFSVLYARPFCRIKERRRGMNLLESGSTGTGISSMICILAGWSINGSHLSLPTHPKTTVRTAVTHIHYLFFRTAGIISSYSYTWFYSQHPGCRIKAQPEPLFSVS